MVYSVAQARRHLEQKYQVICDQTLATTKTFLEGKKAELLQELEDAVRLQGELPMFDLSTYQLVDKFTLTNPRGAMVQTLKVGDMPTKVNIPLQAGAEYECYFLMRAKPKEEKKA
jgi:hypothetical protein